MPDNQLQVIHKKLPFKGKTNTYCDPVPQVFLLEQIKAPTN